MAAPQSRPEPMNASPHHSKVLVDLSFSDPAFVAGTHISGKLQVECRADLDSSELGIGVMMVELYAIQEVHSGVHSATSTFIHARRIFQGPGLPPSNAVYSDHVPSASESPLPAHHYAARRGQTTFFFQFPLPVSSPSSINFGPASIRYEVRASVSVAWRGDKRLVTDTQHVKVVQAWDPSNAPPSPQAAVITDGGKIWAQATLTNDIVVGGESACIDLQLKNHTQRWTSGVTVTLTRDLVLSTSFLAGKSPPNFSDVATQVEFRGPEYTVPPGVEGIARLVVNIPRHSRGVKGGFRVDDNGKATDGFFEVRCSLRLSIDMPPGSEDTVIILPVTIYHSLAVPEIPASPPHLTCSPYSYPSLLSPGLHSPPVSELYTGDPAQQYDPSWTPPSLRPVPDYLPNPHLEQETHEWQDASYCYAPPMLRSVSVGPPLQTPCYEPTSYTPSLRLLPPPPTHVSPTNYVHPGLPIESIDGFTSPNHIPSSPASQNMLLFAPHQAVSPDLAPRQEPQPLEGNRARPPPPIRIPSLPNPHDARGVVHSPRPVPSPGRSFIGPTPRSDNVAELERMADRVGKNLSLELPKGGARVDTDTDRRPGSRASMHKTLPVPPVPSSKLVGSFVHRPRVETLFSATTTSGNPPCFPSSTDAPPTPPMTAITPIKFLPKAPTKLSGLGANLGKDMPSESGLDALERRLLAQVGTHRFEAPPGPHVRSVVQPISIPPSAVPTAEAINDSAISSLTLADGEGVLKAGPGPGPGVEREQDHDRDSDERTQHMGGDGGRQSPSEDDRDARTQKGKNGRKLGRSGHSEEDLEMASRRRERRRVKDDEGRKLRQEAKGRIAAWLCEIDASVPPAMDDPTSFVSPTTSHFVPISGGASFGPALASVGVGVGVGVEERRGEGTSTDRDVSASPNPRSSGFVTVSSLGPNGAAPDGPSIKPSPRRSSVNDVRCSPERLPLSRSPSADVKRSSQPQPSPTPLNRLFPRLPRISAKPVDPEVKYDVQSARGGRGGKVTHVASLWASKTDGDATSSVLGGGPKKRAMKLAFGAGKRGGAVSTQSSPTGVGETSTGPGISMGMGLGVREASKVAKATTVPAVLSSSHAVPMLSSTASLARTKAHVGTGQGPGQGLGLGLSMGGPGLALPPMISETLSDSHGVTKGSGASTGAGGRQGRDLAFGQARLRDLIKKYQG